MLSLQKKRAGGGGVGGGGRNTVRTRRGEGHKMFLGSFNMGA